MAAPTVLGRTAPVAGLTSTSPGGTNVGDVIMLVTFQRDNPTYTLQDPPFNLIQNFFHNDGSADARLGTAYAIATSSGANSYQAFASSLGLDQVWTGMIVIDPATVDLASIVSAAATVTTGSSSPNPPNITLDVTRDWLVVAIGGYVNFAGGNPAVTAPTNYSNLQRNSGAADATLATAERALLAPASENPGAFGGTSGPGSCGMTVGFRSPPLPGAPRHSAVAFNDPGVMMERLKETWQRTRGRIFVPDLWLPEPRVIVSA